MVRDSMLRKCSFCGQHGHNTRTCSGHGSSKGVHGAVKLFGVNISEQPGGVDAMKKSRSMGNLGGVRGGEMNEADASSDHEEDSGYLSDGVIQNKRCKAAHERQKGRPWSEEEHRTFLAGLDRLGKGDWKGIATKFVLTRTPTQVASHAQKFFLRRHASPDRRKRKSSLFDIPYRREEVACQSYSQMKSATENPAMASGSQTLPGNSSDDQILSRFPHLCLDNYHARVRPIAPAYNAMSAQNYLPARYTVGMAPNVQPWPMNMMMNHAPSYMYNATNTYAPIMPSHPSGIPQPRSTPSSPAPVIRDGLDLTISQPQPNQPPGSSPPSTGVISVT